MTRPGKFGNPFPTSQQFRAVLTQIVDGSGDQRVCCGLEEFGKMIGIAKRVEDLRGKDLACWCRVGNPCHADVLIEFANRPLESTQ